LIYEDVSIIYSQSKWLTGGEVQGDGEAEEKKSNALQHVIFI
jgi:hypothetical protein